jgi:hypothetical protein
MPRDNSSRTAVPVLCLSGDVRLYHTLNPHLPMHWLTLHPSLCRYVIEGFTAFRNVIRVEAAELNLRRREAEGEGIRERHRTSRRRAPLDHT